MARVALLTWLCVCVGLHSSPCLPWCPQFLQWSDNYGGINRFKFLWHDVVLVTDPSALASIMGRGEHSVDKAFETYAPINKMCDPHGQVRHSTAAHHTHDVDAHTVLVCLHNQVYIRRLDQDCKISSQQGSQQVGVTRSSLPTGLAVCLTDTVSPAVPAAQPADSRSR